MKNALIQIINTTDSIEDLRDRMCLDTLPGHLASMIITNPNGSHTIQHVFDRTFIAGEPCDTQRAAEVYGLDDEEDIPTLDIDKSDWESIKKAAAESSWIPKEHYFQNDWVADVCRYLREGHKTNEIGELSNKLKERGIPSLKASETNETTVICLWPDGFWCRHEDLEQFMMNMNASDDFRVLHLEPDLTDDEIENILNYTSDSE